jgi:serine/threonine protein kinase
MSDEWNKIKAIFLAALDKMGGVAERAAYLDEACAGNAALRERVDALLQAHDRPDRLLDQPAAGHLVAGADVTNPKMQEQQPDASEALDFLSPSQRPDSLGRLGHYEVLAVLGRGAMGIVLRAFDEKLHRVVALKVLAPALAGNGSARQRFVREARAAAAVTHENVIAIYAVEDDGPVPYLVMQCIDGKTLQEKLDATGPLELKTILRIGLQMAEGLAAAHRQGLIHRDIKPANILLENGVERVKITDFGLARAVDDASMTRSGYIAGTPLFMSPEQARGERVDHRSDLFSLGSVLYTLCAGHPAFRSDTALAVLKRVCEDTPRSLREINPATPEWLEAIIARLHSKDPAARFGTAQEVARLLSDGLAQVQTGAAPGEMLKIIFPHRGRRRRRWSAAVALALVVAGVPWWFLAGKKPSGTVPAPQTEPAPQPATEPSGPLLLQPARKLTMHTSGVRSLAYSPDGSMLASGGLDRQIYLWDTKTWQARGPLEGHAGQVSGLAFSPDGTRLASVTSEPDSCLIRLWDVATGQAVATLGTGEQGMWGLAFSPDGQTLACGGWDRQLHLLDVTTGSETRLISDVATRHLRQLSFSPDGRQIVTGGSGPTRLWDTATGEEISTPVALPESLCPTFLPDGKGLAGWVYPEGQVALCYLPSGQVGATWRAHPHPHAIEGLAVSSDGRFLASIGNDGLAHLWSTADQTKVATLVGHKGAIFAVAMPPDTAHLATGGWDDFTICIWDLPAICRATR